MEGHGCKIQHTFSLPPGWTKECPNVVWKESAMLLLVIGPGHSASHFADWNIQPPEERNHLKNKAVQRLYHTCILTSTLEALTNAPCGWTWSYRMTNPTITRSTNSCVSSRWNWAIKFLEKCFKYYIQSTTENNIGWPKCHANLTQELVLKQVLLHFITHLHEMETAAKNWSVLSLYCKTWMECNFHHLLWLCINHIPMLQKKQSK